MTYYQLKQRVYFLAKANVTNFPEADMVRSFNSAVDRVVSLIFQADARWQFDDTNQTDLSIATTALVADQQDYSIASSHLSITRMEVKDEGSNWTLLKPIDQADIYDQSLTDFMNGSGIPQYYDKIGNSIFLYPKPSYSQAASLKVYFERGPVAVTTTSISASPATEAPGFNTLYHDLIALYAAYDFAVSNAKPNANQLLQDIQKKEAALQEDYALRSRDEHIGIKPRASLSGRGFFR